MYDEYEWFYFFRIDGERTNGMEMSAEREDYVNRIRDAASSYLQDFRAQFDKIGEPYAQFKAPQFLASN